MEIIIVVLFVVGYVAIALEHPIKINKTASALLTGVLCWTLYALSSPGEIHHIGEQLGEHLSEISSILFFLMGAMTIVELVDAYQGFRLVTDRINTKDPRKLLWIICAVTFFLSAILDNLTTSIVMVSLIRKLVPNKKMRLFFAGMIVVSANAGGAWSPIGDVTTTMLWIGGQITAGNIVATLIIPSLVCMVIPLLYLQFTLKGDLGDHSSGGHSHGHHGHGTHPSAPVRGSRTMLFVGVGGLISVPVFKTITHLPPYMGMMLALGVLWVVSELINPNMDEADKRPYTAAGALSRIDVPSVLFFLGILLAVSSLQSMGTLGEFAAYLDKTFGDNRIIITLIGLLSSIVDNVPLVAASMGMYGMDLYPADHMIWEYLAYCAGTGGSVLIIGSAAGVAVMGMEKIDFIWYMKKISLLALLGYFAGAAAYLVLYPFFSVHH
ncbi:MAG: sodium:proton antiporter NhaD [Cyclobacteriaceae bacterium]|nr:sodium:proton antiporter NhaD [Cyclobacteriaceae bacterium]MCB0498926.1 sodium:proton antiporter NhaD [Cyclobacteriaceae bacterium]MCB9238202.1 sodium:proton antiporter NhaD [Flammeovirgaceae bacterium]MCO5272127.1 sodium:proton antiporter NhaD [Cyclobacteriaceae bacterium]MCW5902758.1 sodium:proton antiporter NhaD [Cyclobacteriaceae bacterium]